MKKYNFIAVKGIANDAGIGIVSINYGINDTITSVFQYGEKQKKPTTAKIRYSAAGDPYFMKYGRREYLNEYMKTED